MSVKIRDRDRGFKRLLADAKEAAKGAGVSVGVHTQAGSEAHKARSGAVEATVLDVAIWNEFGLGVPERSFIRAWFDANQGKSREALERGVKLVLQGKMTLQQLLELLGLKFVGEIQKQISQGIPPPNAPSTIAEKGSSMPLIDTGQLRQLITYLVTTKASSG